MQTLNFAQRAKKIKTRAAANVMRSPAEMMLMIEKLKAEVRALRAQLEENGIKPNIKLFQVKAEEPDTPALLDGEASETSRAQTND